MGLRIVGLKLVSKPMRCEMDPKALTSRESCSNRLSWWARDTQTTGVETLLPPRDSASFVTGQPQSNVSLDYETRGEASNTRPQDYSVHFRQEGYRISRDDRT